MTFQNRLFNKIVLAFLIFLVMFPALFLGFVLYRYSVNFISWDSWLVAETIANSFTGQLTFKQLFAQHNESRKFFPRLIFIALAHLTKWNVKYEILANFIFTVLISGGIFWLSIKTVGLSKEKLLLLFFLGNLLIFSPVQFHNWIWGLQLVVFIPVFCLVACIVVAYSKIPHWFKILLYFILCIFSTFSFSNGLICWFVVFLLLFLPDENKMKNWRELKWTVLLWSCLFLLCLMSYYWGYRPEMTGWDILAVFLRPLKAFWFFSGFLGNSLGYLNLAVARRIGMVILGLFITFGMFLIKERKDSQLIYRAYGWFLLGSYSIITGLLTVFGRFRWGVLQPLAPRYTTFSIYLIVALFYLSAIYYEKINDRRKIFFKLSGVLLLAIFLVFLFFSSVEALAYLKIMRTIYLEGKAALLFINICPKSDFLSMYVWRDLIFLKKQVNRINDLRLLRPALVNSKNIDGLTRTPEAAGNFGQFRSFIRTASGYLVSGQAFLPYRQRPADAVIMTYRKPGGREEIFDLFFPDFRVKDIYSFFRKDYLNRGRWLGFLAFSRAFENSRITAWAFDAEVGQAYRLENSFKITGSGKIVWQK